MSRQGKLGCPHCNWSGVTKHSFWNGEKEELTATLCSQCKDTRGYSLYVKQRYSNGTTLQVLEGKDKLADVIDFYRYKDNGEMRYYNKEESAELGKKQFEEFGEIPRMK